MAIRPLSAELQAKAINELNEDPERIQQDLQAIRDWAKSQPHLTIRTDNQWLLNYLRGCKFNLDLVKQKLDLLYSLKTQLPEFFSNRDPFLPEIQDLLKLGTCLPLPKTADPTAPRVVLIRAKNIDPNKIKPADGVKLILMIIEILLNEDDTCVISGGNIFTDNTGLNMQQLLVLPGIVPQAYKCLNDAYCLNPQGIYVTNLPPFAEASYEMYKPMIDPEVLKMLHIYNERNAEDLYKSIPLSVLPKEYGGDGGTIEELTNYWKDKVESYKDWFVEDAKFGSDESKRPGGPKKAENMFQNVPFMNFRTLMDFD